MSHERRRDPRIRITLPGERVRRGNIENVEIIEASYRGVLLKMNDAPRLNELMKIRVRLPSRIIVLHPVPVRIVEHKGALAVGCKLFALSGADKSDWQHHLATLINPTARAA